MKRLTTQSKRHGHKHEQERDVEQGFDLVVGETHGKC